jgi:hypothetical protein
MRKDGAAIVHWQLKNQNTALPRAIFFYVAPNLHVRTSYILHVHAARPTIVTISAVVLILSAESRAATRDE